MPDESDSADLQGKENNDSPVGHAEQTAKPKPRKKKQSSTSEGNAPPKKASHLRRKPSWWNKTANTNKILIFVAPAGVLVAAIGIWFGVRQFREQHRPLIIISRPIELIGPISCDAQIATIQIKGDKFWFKNVGPARASKAFGSITELKLVPEKKLVTR
jgi:hypothetical protein